MYCYSRVFLLVIVTVQVLANCEFSLKKHIPKTPLLLSSSSEIIYPQTNNSLTTQTGWRSTLTCGTKRFKKFQDSKTLTIRCNQGDIVTAHSQRVHFHELECETFSNSTLQKNRKRCYKNGTIYSVGFQNEKKFLSVIHTCFDSPNQDAIYTWYNYSLLSKGQQSNVTRPEFEHDHLYRFNVSYTYRYKHQIKWFAKLLQSDELAHKYIKDDGKHFLARGHLTPKADFVYGIEQSATFHYINVAPQWQCFNDGNWRKMENAVRDEVSKKDEKYVFTM